jgi:hypothetical protein
MAMITCLFCSREEEIYFCHLYGYIKDSADSTGIDGMQIDIYDIDPEQTNQSRVRTVASETKDSISGFFELDSVCWGTSQMQGVGYVTIRVDSMYNSGYPTKIWQPDLHASVDTIDLYIE